MSQTKKLFVIIILLVFSLGAVFWIIYQKKKTNDTSETKQNQLTENNNYSKELKGKVYLTMREKNTGRYGIHIFDFETKMLQEEYMVKDCLILGGEINYAGVEMAVSSNCGKDNASQIYMANQSRQNKPITKNSKTVKKEAVWSDDGSKVAFMATPIDKENTDMADWEIMTSDLEGNEKFVAKAVHPFFSPDGKKILALRKDGLFLFNAENEKEEAKKVHTFRTEASISFQIDLSRKKDLLAISNPVGQDITIFRIKDWDNFQMEEINKIETKNSYASWPKFDPNSDKYLITEEIDNEGKIELIAYNLETKERHSIVDLSYYDQQALWINDWR